MGRVAGGWPRSAVQNTNSTFQRLCSTSGCAREPALSAVEGSRRFCEASDPDTCIRPNSITSSHTRAVAEFGWVYTLGELRHPPNKPSFLPFGPDGICVQHQLFGRVNNLRRRKGIMRPVSIIGMVVCIAVWTPVLMAQSLPLPRETPQEVIEELWGMAVRGELLTPKGWNRAGDYFTSPTPWTTNRTIVVMSNDYGFDDSSISDGTARAAMMCDELGQIDADLRYTSLPPKPTYKSGLGYDLVAVPAHTLVSIPGAKKPEEEVNSNVTHWKVKGSPGNPWTTVNTAVRYVLEARERTRDPVIRKNADRTLAALLKLH
jgi:hypothetical protein